jgi:hypothetical protein
MNTDAHLIHPLHLAARHEPRAVPTGPLAATVLADALWPRRAVTVHKLTACERLAAMLRRQAGPV